jgi:hypothetical protein
MLRQFGRAFQVGFRRLRLRGHVCRDVTQRATLPARLARRILFVRGLKTYPPLVTPAPPAVLNPGKTVTVPGTTLQQSADSAGTVLEDQVTTFTIHGPAGAVIFSGSLQDRVLKSTSTGRLIFIQRVFGTQAALPGTVVRIRRGNFSGRQLSVDYRLDGLGQVAPVRAWRSGDGRVVQLAFPSPNQPAPLNAGAESRFCEIKTDAVTYASSGRTAIVARIGASPAMASTEIQSFSPSQ